MFNILLALLNSYSLRIFGNSTIFDLGFLCVFFVGKYSSADSAGKRQQVHIYVYIDNDSIVNGTC